MFCEKCGQEFDNSAAFCPFCGAKQPDTNAETSSSVSASTETAEAPAYSEASPAVQTAAPKAEPAADARQIDAWIPAAVATPRDSETQAAMTE